jgi:tRNA U34 5-carboxymethylaminomethyl modifying enzyme MnmG/GidA
LTESLGVYQETRLSTHERQQEKIKKRIEQLEKSNLDPKHWTLQGEVPAILSNMLQRALLHFRLHRMSEVDWFRVYSLNLKPKTFSLGVF